ncbi:hypothetical protein BKA69DRAFT_154164 [Paraphysoderma sedebokerense]|nr:hypothetical protein BKA69DRAFT_154164 [Paraphysoderma sedebokerense]
MSIRDSDSTFGGKGESEFGADCVWRGRLRFPIKESTTARTQSQGRKRGAVGGNSIDGMNIGILLGGAGGIHHWRNTVLPQEVTLSDCLHWPNYIIAQFSFFLLPIIARINNTTPDIFPLTSSCLHQQQTRLCDCAAFFVSLHACVSLSTYTTVSITLLPPFRRQYSCVKKILYAPLPRLVLGSSPRRYIIMYVAQDTLLFLGFPSHVWSFVLLITLSNRL